jgi:hypothetical protein
MKEGKAINIFRPRMLKILGQTVFHEKLDFFLEKYFV